MHLLTVAILVCLHCAHGIILKGPSGVVTDKGPIGPTGPATGGWKGDEGWGGEDDGGHYHVEGHWESELHEVVGFKRIRVPVVVEETSWGGDVGGWDGEGVGWGAEEGGWGGKEGGWGGEEGVWGKGVVVKGPGTVPAVIVGPSGKISADGLYGLKKKW